MPAATAEQALKDGDLDGALAQLEASVRKDPSSAELRVFLFQLLSVMGEWDRALTQLNVAGDLDAGTLMMVQTYRELLQCEPLRNEIFAGRKQPMVFGDPMQWVAELIEALRVGGEGNAPQAVALRDQAFDKAPTTTGTIDGTPFEWIADADSRLGPVLEAVVNGSYCWVPFVRIGRIEIEEPTDLRDLVWMGTTFTWSNGGQSTGMIPTRYPGSAELNDGAIRLSRRTEWNEHAEGFHGIGQRLLATDGGEYPLTQIRVIELETTDDSADEAAGEQGVANG